MSTTSVFFIPSTQFPVGQFKTRVRETLEELNIIDGFYDEAFEQYATTGKPIFEYASIHDTDKHKLVPEGSSGGYGSTCSHCNEGIDDDFYSVLNDYYEYEMDSDQEKDMRALKITCPRCNTQQNLGELKFSEPVVFTNQFFQFVDIDDDADPQLIKELESKLSCQITVIYERM